MDDPTDWHRLGGEAGVREHVDAFLARVFDDFVIGFLFEGRDRDRIAQHEVELASTHLGGDLGYRGRPLATLHRALRINGGQFRRRLAILRHVLTERGVPADIVERWVAHDARMERVITDGTDCAPGEGDR